MKIRLNKNNAVDNTDKDKEILLENLKEANAKITRLQRATMYKPLEKIITKPIFNQIVRGTYVSKGNIKIAQSLLKQMEEYVKTNEEYIEAN